MDELQRQIGDLKGRGLGVLITDHNVRDTLRICDRAYLIAEGRILEQGTPQLPRRQPGGATEVPGRGLQAGLTTLPAAGPREEEHNMGLELKQSLRLSQQLVMTPQLQQAIKLLQLSRTELEQEIASEMEQNPALELAAETAEDQLAEKAPGEASLEAENIEAPPAAETAPDTSQEVTADAKSTDIDWEQYLENYQTLGHTAPSGQRDATSEEMPGIEATLTKRESLFDHLLEQLTILDLNEAEMRVGHELIGNIDDARLPRAGGRGGRPADPDRQLLRRLPRVGGAGAEDVCRGSTRRAWAPATCRSACSPRPGTSSTTPRSIGTIIKQHMKQLESKNYPGHRPRAEGLHGRGRGG